MINRIATSNAYLERNNQVDLMTSQMNNLTNEISSGKITDPAGQLGAQAPVLYQLQYDNDQQTELQTSITAAGQQLTATQNALTSVGSTVSTMVTAALQGQDTASSDLTTLASDAQSAVPQVIDLLNTQYAGQALFSGHDGSDLPMADAATVSTAMQGVLSAQVAAKGAPLTAADVPALITALEAVPVNSTAFTANDDHQAVQVATGATARTSYNVSADQPVFQNMVTAMSMMSLLNAPSTQLDASAQQALLTQASNMLSQSQTDLTNTQGTLGVTQAQLISATSIQQSAADATSQQITQMETIDPYSASQQLDALQTQLQSSYEVSSRISQMSFVNYMPSLS
jgi:flagellar hook-associated protein 3 FlgL